MDVALLWIEGYAALLFGVATAVALEKRVDRGPLRLLLIVGLVGVSILLAMMLFGTLGISITLQQPKAIAFYGAGLAALITGGALILRRGLRAEAPGLPVRAADWSWRALAIACAAAASLFGTTLHYMRIAADQQVSAGLADLRELMHQLEPPVPTLLNSAPLYEEAYPHLLRMDDVPGARAAFEQLDASAAPTAAQAFAGPLVQWLDKNRVALELAEAATRRPAYASLEEANFTRLLLDRSSRIAKVADLEISQPRPDARVVGHLTGRGRIAALLEVRALQHAASGQRGLAAEDVNTLYAMLRHHGDRAGPLNTDHILEMLLAQPGWTEAELAALDIRPGSSLKHHLQVLLTSAELNGLSEWAYWSNPRFALMPDSRWASIGVSPLNLLFSLTSVLTVGNALEHLRANYDALWKAIYAPPAERLAAFDTHALAARQERLDGFDWQLLRVRFNEIMRDAAGSSVAGTGLAVARFRLQHGRAPLTLDELVPEFLPEVPADPFTGAPLHYKLEGSAALVYSVGPDARDDGGKPIGPADNGLVQTGDIPFRVPLEPAH